MLIVIADGGRRRLHGGNNVSDMSKMKTNSQRGFSLVELLIVCGIALVMVAMSAPLVMNITNEYRLRSGGTEYANLLQSARVRAVTADTYEPVYATTGSLYGGFFNAFIDLNQQGGSTGTYTSTPASEPGIVFSNSVVIKSAASAPSTANLYSQFLPGIGSTAVAINPNTWVGSNTAVVSFGARGLPCYLTAAPPTNGGGTCSYTINSGGVLKPVAFEIFLQNQTSGMWEAITVNPAGRVREWRYDSTSSIWNALD
jgi:prepilin-type N-terminal cleavage/methylation domain-containing protein